MTDSERLLLALAPEGGHIVASSYGANAAVIAAQQQPEVVHSLALFEPACFDLVRETPAVEEHIAAMSPAYAVANDARVSARDFSRLFSEGMGTEPPILPAGELLEAVGRLRSMSPPWGTGIVAALGLPVPTLVVTGGCSDLYDQTARALVALGATHVELPGAGHSAHKDTRSTELLRGFWEKHAG